MLHLETAFGALVLVYGKYVNVFSCDLCEFRESSIFLGNGVLVADASNSISLCMCAWVMFYGCIFIVSLDKMQHGILVNSCCCIFVRVGKTVFFSPNIRFMSMKTFWTSRADNMPLERWLP